MTNDSVWRKFREVVSEIGFLVQNDRFPLRRLEGEAEPDSVDIVYTPVKPEVTSSDLVSLSKKGLTVRLKPTSVDRNITCQLCPERISGIRSFLHRGRKPILVLHYTGRISAKQPVHVKRSPGQIFSSQEAMDLFDRMIQKVFGFSALEFYFQEFPGCNFKPDSPQGWKQWTQNCESQVHSTIEEFGIQAILILGSSASLIWGREEASGKLGEIFSFCGVHASVVRSPEAILALETKRKQAVRDGNPSETERWKSEEIQVKNSVLNEISGFHRVVQDLL